MMYARRLLGKPGYFWFLLVAVLSLAVAISAVGYAIVRPNQLASCLKRTLDSRNAATVEALQKSIDSEKALALWLSSFRDQVKGPPATTDPGKKAALALFIGNIDAAIDTQNTTIGKQLTLLNKQRQNSFAQCR